MDGYVFRAFINELEKIASFTSEVATESANLAKKVFQARKGNFAGLPKNTVKELNYWGGRPQSVHNVTKLPPSSVSPNATPDFLARIRAQNAAAKAARARPSMPAAPMPAPRAAPAPMQIRSAA